MIFSVTYYLELRNAISIYYTSHIFTNRYEIDRLDIIEHYQLDLVKNITSIIKRYNTKNINPTSK